MITEDEKRILLHDVKGIGTEHFPLPDGVDQDGKIWIYRRQNGGTHRCAICNEQVTEGWTCFDDGTVVCPAHVSITGKV